MAKYVDSANVKHLQGDLNDLAIEIQALITDGRTIVQVVKGRETGRFIIIHTA